MIAGIFSIIYFLGSQKPIRDKQQILQGIDTAKIRQYVQSCVDQTAKNALLLAGLQGGYTYANNYMQYIYFNYFYIPIYYEYNYSTMPDNAFIEDTQLSDYIKYEIDGCLGDFSDLKPLKIELVKEQIESSAQILDKMVQFRVTVPLVISIGPQRMVLDDPYRSIIPTRLGEMLTLARQINAQAIQDPGAVDLNHIEDITPDGMTVDIYPYDARSWFDFTPYNKDNLIYHLKDTEYLLDGQPYPFMFAQRFHYE